MLRCDGFQDEVHANHAGGEGNGDGGGCVADGVDEIKTVPIAKAHAATTTGSPRAVICLRMVFPQERANVSNERRVAERTVNTLALRA